jgi:hypothetical protein
MTKRIDPIPSPVLEAWAGSSSTQRPSSSTITNSEDLAFWEFLSEDSGAIEQAHLQKTSDKKPVKASPPLPTPTKEKTAHAEKSLSSIKSLDDSDWEKEDDEIHLNFKHLQNTDWLSLQQLGQAQTTAFQNNMSPYSIDLLPQLHYQSLNVSKTLEQSLEKAYKDQKNIRITLNDDISIILKLKRSGQVSAEFLPNTRAAELFFKSQINDLKQRLESKALPAAELNVRSWQEHTPEQQNQNKEDSRK